MQGQDNGTSRGRRFDVLVPLCLVMVSAVLLKLPGGAQDFVAQALRSSLLSPFVAMNVAYAKGRALTRDFDRLHAQVDSLLARVAAQRVLAEENRQLRDLLEIGQRSPSRYVATPVIRSGTTGPSVFRVAVGAEQGVRAFDAVITEAGLLGQVQRVGASTASAFDWSHPEFRVSAMTVDGVVHGLVRAERGRFREMDRMVLSGTAYLSGLRPGTELLTSGRGGTYARGIRVGWVAGVAATAAGWSKSYYVEPAVQPGAASFALVDLGPVAEAPGGPEAADDAEVRDRDAPAAEPAPAAGRAEAGESR